MSLTPSKTQGRRLISYVLVALVAGGLWWWSQHWWAAACWLSGHLFIACLLPRMEAAKPTNSRYPAPIHAWVAGAGFVVFIVLLQFITSARFGWRGFQHLSDLPPNYWGLLLALLAPALGVWLLALQQIQQLQYRVPKRRQRLLWLGFSALTLATVGWLPWVVADYLPLAFSLGVLLFSIDIYLESNRTSMTWLLLWLFLLSLVIASFAFQQSQRIDLQAHRQIAEDISQFGHPDTSRQYHLPIRWDTMALVTAQQRLRPEHLAMTPGSGRQWVNGDRSYWILHRSDGQGFVMAGRSTGGIKPLFALTSLIFLAGLGYCLLLRAFCWLMGYPYTQWLLPLFGPSSLRVRIQLSFFGLVLVAFLLVGWFTVDFFRGKPELQEWLEQVLSLYVFLLLIAGALGIFLANSITEPIVRIGEKLGDTQLLNNQPLSWPKDDEIGRLVSNYNRMITDLNESALQLAASEREGAWREMAKQVAHEIKNPLTPMKLQLQQLVRLEKEAPEKAREWSKVVATRIIEQIDGLALIADEFSHFARLPAANVAVLDLRDLVQSAYDLHHINENKITLALDNSPVACLVLADRDQLLRVANNLIQNAFQAIGPQTNGSVNIKLEVLSPQVVLSVMDNGPGIAPDIRERIFRPNFTTKSSGMGLGLAMCRNIVQQAGGQISFQTNLGQELQTPDSESKTPDSGTIFRVELPLVSESGVANS